MSGYLSDEGDDITEIAREIIARADAHKWAGEKGDDYALEAACAALGTVRALYGSDNDLTRRMHRFALLAQVEGLKGLRKRAAEPTGIFDHDWYS